MNLSLLQGRLISHAVETLKSGKDVGLIIVEVSGYGDKKVPIPVKVLGKLVEALQGLQDGRGVMVQAHLDGREYQGKFYSEVIADKIVHAVQSDHKGTSQDYRPTVPKNQPEPVDEDSIPF